MPALIVDPELQAEVIRQFNLRGDLSPFQLTEQVVPIFDIGRLVSAATVQEVVTPNLLTSVLIGLSATTRALVVGDPSSSETQVFSDTSVAPGAGTVLADTGAVGTVELQIQAFAGHNDGTPRIFTLEWRNAANSATIASFPMSVETSVGFKFRGIMATGERFRWVTATAVTNTAVTWIAASQSDSALAN